MRLVEKLLAHGKTILTETELQQLIREADYSLFLQVVEKLLDDGILAPVKFSGQWPAAAFVQQVPPAQTEGGLYRMP